MKKKILLSLIVLMTFSLFAIPGVVDIIPTESGQYVYYKDNGFKTETYIGFLQYDESTYSIRYYAPEPETGSKEIELLLTIDPSVDYVLMTGERIVSDVTMDDNTVINYLHDLFYELSSRRKKVTFDFEVSKSDVELSKTTKSVNEDFFQYGGDVVMEYDLLIPVFNLRTIRSGTNAVLEAVTMGKLVDSADSSFVNFTGFSFLPTKTVQKDLAVEDLESKWVEQGNGFWFIGNDAMLVSYGAEFPHDFSSTYGISVFDYAAKNFSLSTGGAYIYLPRQEIKVQKDSLVVINSMYMSDTQQYTKDLKVLRPLDESSAESQIYNMCILSAFEDFYHANKTALDKTILTD